MKTQPRRVVLVAALVASFAVPLRAQDPAAQAEIAGRALPEGEAAWLRYPAISPDGRTIVFSYLGDLWRVPTAGGDAVQLTRHPGYDHRPVWSPDGSRVAFASDRFGNDQVFVMDATGGVARRLTFHSAAETPYAFTPDGARVVFGATRLDDAENRQFPSGSLPELYQVSVDGGRVTQLTTLPAEEVAFGADGGTVVYQDRKGGEDEWRKYHRSAITRDLWVWDRTEDTHRQLTTSAAEDRDPVLSPAGDAVFYLSEESGSYNVHRIALSGGASEQLTHLTGAPVRFLSAADDGTLAFGHDGLLYTLAAGATDPVRVPVRISTEHAVNDERIVDVSDDIDGVAVSPTGKEIAFLFRGEVLTTSVETGTTKRITETAAEEEDVRFTPDSAAVIYASQRDGRWGIWEARPARDEETYFFASTLIEESPLVVNERQNMQPILSPDGTRLAFVEDYHTLRVLDRASGEVVTLLTEAHIFNGGQFEWSPDGDWMLFTWDVPGRATPDVGVVRTDGSGEIHNLTRSGFVDTSPQWILGGRGMIWRSNRDGLRSLRATGSTEADVYAMFFTQDAWDEFRLTEEELALLRETRGGGESEEEEREDDEAEPVVPDFGNAFERRARLTIHSSALGDFLVSEDGQSLYYLARFERGLNLWSTNLRTRETRQVLTLNANSAELAWDAQGERIFLTADGDASIVDPDGWDREAIPVDGELVVSRRAERAAMFDQMWRHVRDQFYTRTFHGTDWDAVRGMYDRFLPHIGTHRDFAELLSEALGELNVSHSGGRYRETDDDDDHDETASLGAFYDQSMDAAGLDGVRITEVMRGGPLDRAGLAVEAGTVITSVDGEPLTQSVDLARLLNRKAGRNVLLGLRDPDGSTRDIVVEPVEPSDESQLRYDHWVERNRREVEEQSDGRLGYVHVRSMNDASYRSTFEEVLGRHFGKDGVVVDTRFNPGGDLVADLQMFFSGEHFFEYTTDERSSGFEPSFRWTKPSVVLAAEGNYSDGHCFAWAYKTFDMGPLIGMPVPGTCTFGGGQSLLDGLGFGVPGRGVKDARSGRFLENWQTDPDIRVPNEPGIVDQGRDQQLERAIAELLALVDRRLVP